MDMLNQAIREVIQWVFNDVAEDADEMDVEIEFQKVEALRDDSKYHHMISFRTYTRFDEKTNELAGHYIEAVRDGDEYQFTIVEDRKDCEEENQITFTTHGVKNGESLAVALQVLGSAMNMITWKRKWGGWK